VLRLLERVIADAAEVGVDLIVTRHSINIGDALTTGFLGGLRKAGCATVVPRR
jgi:hypothetical protein